VQHHGAALRELGEEEATIEALATAWRTAPIEGGLRALFGYAERVTLAPASVDQSDVEALRSSGWSDEAILHTCEVVAYFNFVNRLADGLGVRLEPGWDRPLIGIGPARDAAEPIDSDARRDGERPC